MLNPRPTSPSLPLFPPPLLPCLSFCPLLGPPALSLSSHLPRFPNSSFLLIFLFPLFLFLLPLLILPPPLLFPFNTYSPPSRCLTLARLSFRAFILIPPLLQGPPAAGRSLAHTFASYSSPPPQGMIRHPNELLSSTRLQNRCELTQGTIPSPSISLLA